MVFIQFSISSLVDESKTCLIVVEELSPAGDERWIEEFPCERGVRVRQALASAKCMGWGFLHELDCKPSDPLKPLLSR